MQGDAAAPEQFSELYNPVVRAWQLATSIPKHRNLLTAICPFTGDALAVDVSCFADDIARTCVAHEVLGLQQQERSWDSALDNFLGSIGMGQNHSKKEWLLRFVGKHACTKMRQALGAYSGLRGTARLVAKYLGVWENADVGTQDDVSKRIVAARTAWHALSGWWRCKGVALRHRVAVFKVIVVSTLLSGLEPAVLTDTNLGRLESTQMKYLRVIAGALGCDRKPVEMSTSNAPNDPNIPAPYKYTAKSNFDIRALTGVGTMRSVLQQRRLKWLQQMAAHPADHKLVLAVVAGRLAADHTNAFNSNGCFTTHAGP